MHILTHDELPDSFDSYVQLMQLSAGWGIFDFEQVKKARNMGYPSSDYFAVYAVEDDLPVAKVEVIHIEFETPKGTETMCGIGGVLTRRDKSRMGLARHLLQDVHRREKASGIKRSLLWTGRNNKAHNLYESLGYIDVYDPGVSLLKTGSVSSSDGIAVRNATMDDADTIDALHSRITAKRLGFKNRCKNFIKIIFELEFEKPDSIRIFVQNGNPIGYAEFQRNNGWIRSSEVIIEPKYYGQAISLLEGEAKGNWLWFGNSFVSDARMELMKRGYSFSDYTYGTLMVCDLDQATNKENIGALIGINDPKFICQSFDHF